MILTIQGTSDLFLDLELEVTETAAAGLPLRGSQMDATIRDSDGSGKCDLFLSFSPSVSYRQHPSEVHARAAYEAKNFIGWARLALTYPPKLQKRRNKIPYHLGSHLTFKDRRPCDEKEGDDEKIDPGVHVTDDRHALLHAPHG